ncbi:hypothetical protein V6N13_046547 [Hibiscus sabdariffa]|uniref:LysM domain-containing protein n=1 Tax=Hibiscus sabdariffa TaxID=183260 RepID=A0ABR2NZ90_9ROSI
MAPSSSSSPSRKTMKIIKSAELVDMALWYCSVAVLALILIGSIRASSVSDEEAVSGSRLLIRPCDEIYVVTEGETLHSISDKCGDPFIVERNPHIQDPDDVFPGLVIKIIPCAAGKL